MKEGWEVKKLGEVAYIGLGFTHTPEYVEKGIPFLSVKDISSGEICWEDVKFVSKEEYDSAPKGAKPQKGDIMFCRVGTMGKPVIITTDTPFCTFVSLGYLQLLNNNINNVFVKYWMQSNAFDIQVKANVKGVAIKNLNTGWLKEFTIPIPPMAEQERIVKELDCLSGIIEKKKQQLKELDALAQSIFYEMFGDPVENEKGWEVVEFKQVCNSMTKGPFGSDVKKSLYVEKSNDTYKVYIQANAIEKDLSIGTYYITKEYFENKVYAMQYGGKDGRNAPVHGTFKDSWFTAVGKSTVEDVMKDSPHSFNDKDYGGLCFIAKTGIELESVTFTIVAEKECYVEIFLFGPEIDDNGNPSFWNNTLNTVNSRVQFKDYNVTTVDGTKLIKLTPGVPMTFTVDTLAEEGEMSSYSKEADFGKITDACADDETARRFLLSVLPYRINDGFIGSAYSFKSFEEEALGLRFYNISFDVKKLEA